MDVQIPITDNGFGDKHFCIFWDPLEGESGAFKIVDLFQGNGTFALLTRPYKIQCDQAVSFGSSHISFDVIEGSELELKFIGGLLKGNQFTFAKEKGMVQIGRHSNCDV